MPHREDVLRQAHDAEAPPDGVSGAALLAELDRRSAAYHAGTALVRPAAEVLVEMKARQSSEKPP